MVLELICSTKYFLYRELYLALKVNNKDFGRPPGIVLTDNQLIQLFMSWNEFRLAEQFLVIFVSLFFSSFLCSFFGVF